jgi:hypothetical protein
MIASSEKKKFLRLVKAYGRNSICFQSGNLGSLKILANLALGTIASSNFGLGYAEHEPASGVKQTEIRHCTDLRSRWEFQVDSLCQRRQGILTFRRSSRIQIHPLTETRGPLKRQNQYLLVCCAATRIGYMKGVAGAPYSSRFESPKKASHLAVLTTKAGPHPKVTSQGSIMA